MPELSGELFNKIQGIQMQTAQLADDILAGAWHSAFRGMGMEFEEVREYQTGDDVRSIDWNVTARMNHPYVKVFQEERELTVILAVDVSASSGFGSDQELKRDLIAEIGAVLAFSAIKNNDKVGLILFSDHVEKFIPPKKGTRHVLRVIRELLAYEPKGRKTELMGALSFLGRVVKHSGICFLISDFLCLLPYNELAVLAKKHDLISVAVTDPCELEFPRMELVTLKDLETHKMALIDSSHAGTKEHFKQLGEGHLNEVKSAMQKIGAGFIDIRTDAPYLAPLRKFFKLREIKR